MKALLITTKPETTALLKAHVEGYTRTDGTVVQTHEDRRPAAKLKAFKPKKGGQAKVQATGAVGTIGRVVQASTQPYYVLHDDKGNNMGTFTAAQLTHP